MNDNDLPAIRPHPSEDGQPGLHVALEGYQVSDEVAGVSRRLIDRHQRLAFLEDWDVGYLLHHADPPDERSPHQLGRARLVPKHFLPYSSVAATISVNAAIWQVLTEPQREALVLHHLLHLGTHPKTGELVILPHDVEEFGFVAATYGAWEPGLREFGRQLVLALGEAGA